MKNLIILLFLLITTKCFSQTLTVTSNVFSQHATIRFSIPTSDTCSLAVYSRWGALIKTILKDTLLPTGNYSFILNGDSLIARQTYYLVFYHGHSHEEQIIMWEDYTAINEVVNSNSTVRCYPSPSNGRFTVSFPDFDNGYKTVTLYNYLGQSLFAANSANNFIEINGAERFATGVYMVEVKSNNKKEVVKIVITR